MRQVTNLFLGLSENNFFFRVLGGAAALAGAFYLTLLLALLKPQSGDFVVRTPSPSPLPPLLPLLLPPRRAVELGRGPSFKLHSRRGAAWGLAGPLWQEHEGGPCPNLSPRDHPATARQADGDLPISSFRGSAIQSSLHAAMAAMEAIYRKDDLAFISLSFPPPLPSRPPPPYLRYQF